MCETILLNKRRIRPVSHWQDDYGCSLSMPAVLGRGGILATIPLALTKEEKALLEKSAQKLREVLGEIS
jgi:L-lactate dehydrogenase